MTQFPQAKNRFTPKGKMQQAPVGASILAPINAGTRMIVNFVSKEPKFDKKLDKMLERVWRKTREDYFGWSCDTRNFKLGEIKETLVSSDIMVISLLVRGKNEIIDAAELERAIQKLAVFAKYEKGSIHISSVLIDEVPALKELIEKYVAEIGINCYFYDLPDGLRK